MKIINEKERDREEVIRIIKEESIIILEKFLWDLWWKKTVENCWFSGIGVFILLLILFGFI